MMAQIAFLKVVGDQDAYFGQLRTNAYLNITSLSKFILNIVYSTMPDWKITNFRYIRKNQSVCG